MSSPASTASPVPAALPPVVRRPYTRAVDLPEIMRQRIVVLDGGRVVEDGPHAELIEAGGAYANLWSRQTGAYLE